VQVEWRWGARRRCSVTTDEAERRHERQRWQAPIGLGVHEEKTKEGGPMYQRDVVCYFTFIFPFHLLFYLVQIGKGY
jgi:hypothetical protein